MYHLIHPGCRIQTVGYHVPFLACLLHNFLSRQVKYSDVHIYK